MMLTETIREPFILIHEEISRRHIANMAAKARLNGVKFRPHFKTHQSALVGEWFRDEGVEAITVSSVGMAFYFAEAGWRNITIAFPVNLRDLKRIDYLAGEVTLNLIIGSPGIIEILDKNLTHEVGLYIEIDTGYHRSGISPDNTDIISGMIRQMKRSRHLRWKGFLSHFGETYKVQGIEQVSSCFKAGLRQLLDLKTQINQGIEAAISIGDTPSCSLISDFTGVDEIRPGNFVYYDLMQVAIGSCELPDIAICIAAPVVECHPERRELVVHAGAIHLSRESLIHNGRPIFGRAVRITEEGWVTLPSEVTVTHLSQEHGLISFPDESLSGYTPGDLIGILPVHACLAVASLRRCYTIQGHSVSVFNG